MFPEQPDRNGSRSSWVHHLPTCVRELPPIFRKCVWGGQRTQLAVTEGGRTSDLTYVQGGFVNQGLAMSSSRMVTAEEKPFVELDELKHMPNNVALVCASAGEKTLPARFMFLRPLWVFQAYPDPLVETPWADWPEALRRTYDLETLPQAVIWTGWGMEPLGPNERLVPDGGWLGSSRFRRPGSVKVCTGRGTRRHCLQPRASQSSLPRVELGLLVSRSAAGLRPHLGIAPICCMRPSRSGWPRSSTIFPPVNR